MIDNDQLEEILEQKLDRKTLSSELGFFSKPIRVNDANGKAYVVKLYRPIKSENRCLVIMSQHDAYVLELKKTGIQIPETFIQLKKRNNKFQLIIAQAAFAEDELIRGRLETCNESDFLEVLGMVLDDTLKFWSNKPLGIDIGFHPTLRNYAIQQKQLFYFDTFPPMLMPQEELNKLIILMAPVRLNIRFMTPISAINRVSNEYYQIDKMIVGIIGSCCRLRPDFVESILTFSRQYISNANSLNPSDKQTILKEIENPPKLSGIWVTFRKIFGKTGKPNVG